MNLLEFKNTLYKLHGIKKFTRLCAVFNVEIEREEEHEGYEKVYFIAYDKQSKKVGQIHCEIDYDDNIVHIPFVLISPKYAGDEKSSALLKTMINKFEEFYNSNTDGYSIEATVYNHNLKTMLEREIKKKRLNPQSTQIDLGNLSKEEYDKWTKSVWQRYYPEDYSEMADDDVLPNIKNKTNTEIKKEEEKNKLEQETLKTVQSFIDILMNDGYKKINNFEYGKYERNEQIKKDLIVNIKIISSSEINIFVYAGHKTIFNEKIDSNTNPLKEIEEEIKKYVESEIKKIDDFNNMKKYLENLGYKSNIHNMYKEYKVNKNDGTEFDCCAFIIQEPDPISFSVIMRNMQNDSRNHLGNFKTCQEAVKSVDDFEYPNSKKQPL